MLLQGSHGAGCRNLRSRNARCRALSKQTRLAHQPFNSTSTAGTHPDTPVRQAAAGPSADDAQRVAAHSAQHLASRRWTVAALLTTCSASLAASLPISAQAAAPAQQAPPDKQQLDELLGTLMDDVRQQAPEQVKELDAFMGLEDSAVDTKRLDAARLKNNFKRSRDGRVFVRGSKGKWYTAKADMYLSGYLLLQDAKGLTYYMAPGEAGDLQQVDLSDDLVVAMVFGTGEWEQVLRPLEVEGKGGQPEHLKLPEEDFRQLLSVMQGEDAGPPEAQ